MKDSYSISFQKDYQEETLLTSLKKVIRESGILEMIKNKNVMIKPNFTGKFDPSSGKVTHPKFLDILIQLIKPKCKNLILAESSSIGSNTNDIFKYLNIDKIAKKHDVKLIDLKNANYMKVRFKESRTIKELELPTILYKTEIIISLAKLKTNFVSTISCSIKNLKGLLQDKDKKRFHLKGLSRSVAELAYNLPKTIGIIDGIIACELYEPKNTGVIIASTEALIADIIASRLMKIEENMIKHINILKRLKNFDKENTLNNEEIKYIDKISNILKINLKTANKGINEISRIFNVKICPNNACSSCIGSLYYTLNKLTNNQLKELSNKRIHLGKNNNNNNQSKIIEDDICFGNCAIKKNSRHNIKGCPPISRDFIDSLY